MGNHPFAGVTTLEEPEEGPGEKGRNPSQPLAGRTQPGISADSSGGNVSAAPPAAQEPPPQAEPQPAVVADTAQPSQKNPAWVFHEGDIEQIRKKLEAAEIGLYNLQFAGLDENMRHSVKAAENEVIRLTAWAHDYPSDGYQPSRPAQDRSADPKIEDRLEHALQALEEQYQKAISTLIPFHSETSDEIIGDVTKDTEDFATKQAMELVRMTTQFYRERSAPSNAAAPAR